MKTRILFVEDDLSLADGLTYALEKQGYDAVIARTRLEAERLWEAGAYELVILDVSLPDGSGYDVCRMIRRTSNVPVIFLTAADEETEIIMGLDIGGDDYITKPFKLAVFLSRVHAILRRSGQAKREETGLSSGGVSVNRLTREVYREGRPVTLTAGEYRLLCLLMEHPNIVLSPEQILSKLWDCDGRYVDAGTLTVYIRRLRAKVEEDPGNPRRIVTVRRMGYKWNAQDGGER